MYVRIGRILPNDIGEDFENELGQPFTFPRRIFRPGDASFVSLRIKRAQGMPGEGLTHGPPATKNAGGSHHRISRINRHSLRDGVTAYT